VISTPNAWKEILAEFVFAANIAPAGNDKLKVSVAASDAGIVAPRIIKYFPLWVNLTKNFICIRHYVNSTPNTLNDTLAAVSPVTTALFTATITDALSVIPGDKIIVSALGIVTPFIK